MNIDRKREKLGLKLLKLEKDRRDALTMKLHNKKEINLSKVDEEIESVRKELLTLAPKKRQ